MIARIVVAFLLAVIPLVSSDAKERCRDECNERCATCARACESLPKQPPPGKVASDYDRCVMRCIAEAAPCLEACE